jgi:hypothetical protein
LDDDQNMRHQVDDKSVFTVGAWSVRPGNILETKEEDSDDSSDGDFSNV